jgi:hypothetical protein
MSVLESLIADPREVFAGLPTLRQAREVPGIAPFAGGYDGRYRLSAVLLIRLMWS